MIMLSRFRWNVGPDVPNILIDALSDDFLTNDSVEEHIELNDNFLEIVFLISIFFSHKETVFFFKNVLNLADYV